MKHSFGGQPQHASPTASPDDVEILPLSLQNPGSDYLREEIAQNRKSERWLILYGTISLILVAILITIRLVFFT